MEKELSIIIPVGNDLRVGDCLDSIQREIKNHNLEVLVVEDQCGSEVHDVISSYTEKIPLNILSPTRSKHIGRLRNTAIKRSNSPIYYFIDSDCILLPGAIEEAIKSGEHHPVTRGYIEFKGDSKIAQIDAMIRQSRYDSDRSIAYCPNLVVQKNVFDTIGMFKEDYEYGSDGEFAKRLREQGISLSYNPNMRVIHNGPASSRRVIRTWIKYGEGRKRRFRDSSVREKIKALITPNLFDIKKGPAYNLLFLGCLAARWYGWSKVYIQEGWKKRRFIK